MGRHSPTGAAIRWTQRFVLGAVGEDAARTRRSSCLLLLSLFAPIGFWASFTFGGDRFTAWPSIAGGILTAVIVVLAVTTRTPEQQHRWGLIVTLIAIDQAIGIYQLGPHGIVLFPQACSLGAWAALYLPTRIAKRAMVYISAATMVALLSPSDRMVTVIAIVIAQLTVATMTLLVHSAVLALRATNGDLDDARRLAHQLATTDALTGAANRRSFTDLVVELENEARSARTLLLVDVDRFKDLNDHHGHLVGDEVLREIARRLADALPRASVARWGGEEFAVLCVRSEHAPGVAAETLRASIASVAIATTSGPVDCTVSIGSTTWISTDSFEDALRRADSALYEAKRTGRNRWAEQTSDSVTADDVRRPA